MAKFALRPHEKFGYVVELDGADISKAVTSVDIGCEPGRPAVIRLDVAAFEVTALTHEDAKVFLAPGTADLLKQLGWTPPAEETP